MIAATGCSPKIQTGGHEIADPDQPLAAALAQLKQDNDAGIQNNSITVSSDTNCFYLKPSVDAEEISSSVACGPIRRLGQPDTRVWDTYRLSFGQPTDGKVSANVGPVSATAVAIDPKRLVSPDDTEPGVASDLPAPTAPQTSVADRAIALPDNSVAGLKFADPAQKTTLNTPTARLSVTGIAQPTTVPHELVAGTDDPAGDAAYYRPAEGQRLYAIRVKVSDPVEKSAVAATAAPDAKAVSLTTALGIGIADGKTLSIVDGTDPDTEPSDASGKLSISCQDGGEQAYPCRPGKSEFVILMSVPSGSAPTLAATVDKHQQSVDPQTGKLGSDVSQIEYDRSDLNTKVDKTLKVPSYTARVSVTKEVPADGDHSTTDDAKAGDTTTGDDTSDATSDSKHDSKGADSQSGETTTKTVTAARKASWSMEVGAADLSAFDPALGWAPAGKAWLVVQTSAYRKVDPAGAFTDRRAGSVTLTADGASYSPTGLTDQDFTGNDPAATDSVNWAFLVPDDLTSADFTFQPTGVVSAKDTTGSFTVDDPAVAKINFKK